MNRSHFLPLKDSSPLPLESSVPRCLPALYLWRGQVCQHPGHIPLSKPTSRMLPRRVGYPECNTLFWGAPSTTSPDTLFLLIQLKLN